MPKIYKFFTKDWFAMRINLNPFTGNISLILAIAAIIITLTGINAFGQDDYNFNSPSFENIYPEKTYPEDSTKKTDKADTTKKSRVKMLSNPNGPDDLDTATFKVNEVKVIGYPYAFYSPETEFAVGVGGLVYFRTALSASQKPSKILVSGYYTTNSQYQFSLKPKLYFPGVKRMYVEGDVYYAYELIKFYGLGNNSPNLESQDYNYKSTSFGVYAEVQMKGFLLDIAQIGLNYDYFNMKMEDKMTNPFLLNDSNIVGGNGGKVGGIGLTYTIDYRDNISFPMYGGFYKLTGTIYGTAMGSDFSYTKHKLDGRQYVTPYKDHVLAFQVYSELTTGSPPFFDLPVFGGSSIMRGYIENRYKDKNFMAGQIEYRKILFWRIGMAAFYSFGEVFSQFKTLEFSKIRSAYGFGLRFVFDPKEKINLRADIGITPEGTGIYFSMDEAF